MRFLIKLTRLLSWLAIIFTILFWLVIGYAAYTAYGDVDGVRSAFEILMKRFVQDPFNFSIKDNLYIFNTIVIILVAIILLLTVRKSKK